MRIAIVENDVIANIIVVPDGADPSKFSGIELPEGLGIGDKLPPTPEERIAALESENKTLKAKITAQSEQMDFYEECIAEMASVVYA